MKRRNRKRKIAMIVGAVVITAVALFPPYVPPDSADIAWTDTEPPVAVFRWIGSDSPQRIGYVTEREWMTVGRDVRGHWSRMLPPPREESIDSEGNRVVRDLDPWVTGEKWVTKRTCIGVPFRISTITLVLSISIAVALTAAAVLLLKDRKLST